MMEAPDELGESVTVVPDQLESLEYAHTDEGVRDPRPMRRIVLGSLLSGWVVVAILALGVFGGAREHAITGSALVGFGFGWAMLAALTLRMTDRPQRWAFVPAVAMGVTGLALLVLAPDDSALTAAGWVWPPLLLLLAIWIGVHARRSLAARSGRRALYLVVALMGGAAAGGMAETLALATDGYAMPGKAYDVGGYRLHLDCNGSGTPVVVLQSGLGELSPSWTRIVRAVDPTTRVCAYDRAGQGWSDDAPRVQDGVRAAADLHTLLVRAGEQGPFVLAGHSTGGAYAMTFAARYPGEVAGMVILDGTDPYRASPMFGSTHAPASAAFALLPSIARLGIGHVVPTGVELPDPAGDQVDEFSTSPRYWGNYRDEIAAIPSLLAQAQALTTFGSKPLIVVTADASTERPAAHDRMAGLSSESDHRFTDETHSGLLTEASGAGVSADAIRDVVDAVRRGGA